jgi:hypothetical protein
MKKKNGTTWYITLTKSGQDIGETVYETAVYNKETIQARFDKWADRLGEGDELEYGKVTPTHFHPYMLHVERIGGKLVQWVAKGGKAFKKEYVIKTVEA